MWYQFYECLRINRCQLQTGKSFAKSKKCPHKHFNQNHALVKSDGENR